MCGVICFLLFWRCHGRSTLLTGLGGKYRECSLIELAWCIRIYEEHKTRSPAFELFLRSAVREYLSVAFGYDFWGTSSIHRLLHRLITFSIDHKIHGDKVTCLNLFFLCIIVSRRSFATFCSIWLATWVSRRPFLEPVALLRAILLPALRDHMALLHHVWHGHWHASHEMTSLWYFWSPCAL